MVDIVKELGSEIAGGFVGMMTMIVLTIAGDPGAFSSEYWLTKVADLAFSGAAALISFLIVHIAKKNLTSPRETRLKRFVKWVNRLLRK